MNSIKNIIFDMGGVLLDYNPYRIVSSYCDSNKDINDIIANTFATPLWSEYDRGVISLDDIYKKAVINLDIRLHINIKNALYNWDKHFIEIDGAEQFIGKLIKNKYSLFLLSNVGNRFHEFYNSEKILRHFSKYVLSCDYKVTKPNLLIYQILINKYDINPSESLFIDDVFANVEGAKKAGLCSEQFFNYKLLEDVLNNKYGIVFR